MRTLGVFAILATILAGFVLFADAAQAADGKDVFQEKCQMCHGAAGWGNEALAKAMKIELSRLALTKQETRAKSDVELAATIKSGKAPMPAFEGKLTDTDIRAVIQFIRSLK